MTSAPQYARIAEDLRVKIEKGEYGPGATLPSDRELRLAYSVSSATARKALATLVSEGLIEVRRGHAPVVTGWKPILRDATARLSAQHWGSGKSVWDADIQDRHLTVASLEVAVTESAPDFVAESLGTTRCLVRDRTFVVDGRPVQFAKSYLPADLVEGTAIARKDTGAGGTPARLAELGFAPARFLERQRSRPARPDEAARLGVPLGRTVTIIVRFTSTEAGRVVEVTEMTLDAEAYVQQVSFTS